MRTYTVFILLITLSSEMLAQTQNVKVDTSNYHVLTSGIDKRERDEPVLIFENGWGMELDNWDKIRPQLDNNSIPYFLYDRSGVGKSTFNGEFPSIQNRSEQLKQLLIKAEIAPPYILVGHSIGGVYIRGYAGLYPEDVVGMVFIDTYDFTQTKEQWKDPFRKAGGSEEEINALLYQQLYDTIRDERIPIALFQERVMLRNLRRQDFKSLDRIPLPDLPMLFFVGTKFDVPANRQLKFVDHAAMFNYRVSQWMDHYNTLICNSKAGGWLVSAAGAGHFVHWDEPEIVVQNILLMYEQCKKVAE